MPLPFDGSGYVGTLMRFVTLKSGVEWEGPRIADVVVAEGRTTVAPIQCRATAGTRYAFVAWSIGICVFYFSLCTQLLLVEGCHGQPTSRSVDYILAGRHCSFVDSDTKPKPWGFRQ